MRATASSAPSKLLALLSSDWGPDMATLTIRDLDDEIRDKLRVRAAEHGRSMEAEVRAILRDVIAGPGRGPEPERGLGSKIHALFAEIGGVEPDELVLPPRTGRARAVDFGE
jgi:plasmid stability protein